MCSNWLNYNFTQNWLKLRKTKTMRKDAVPSQNNNNNNNIADNVYGAVIMT